MLSVACGLAESRHLDRVLIANHGGDHAIYPDCRPQFADAMGKAIETGTYEGITLDTPYTHLSKADIVKRGVSLGVDYTHTWSCYKGQQIHCGKCGTCRERKEAFTLAGIADTTHYEE
jgi:7-cyano-7-deazaguanine synthase